MIMVVHKLGLEFGLKITDYESGDRLTSVTVAQLPISHIIL